MFKLSELTTVLRVDDGEDAQDTCCAASCSDCTNCTQTRAPTPGIAQTEGRYGAMLRALRAQMEARLAVQI